MSNKWMDIAEQELGTKEVRGSEHNDRILEYGQAVEYDVTSDEVPWCSTFANWCMSEAGIQGTRSAAARSWLLWGKHVDTPEKGSVAVFKRGQTSWQGHVAFYVEENEDKIKVLGGNQGNQVSYAWYSKDDLLGYRAPDISPL